ncbi:hypothetical protein Nmel_011059 [Mimus melanotis]
MLKWEDTFPVAAQDATAADSLNSSSALPRTYSANFGT